MSGLTKQIRNRCLVASTSKKKTPEKGRSNYPLTFEKLKSSLMSKDISLSLGRGRTLTTSQVESLSFHYSNLTRKQYRALPAATRSKFRSTIRRHFHHLLKSEPSWVYIIVNAAWPEYCKIGVSNDIKHRLWVYNTHSPSGDFTCVCAEYFHEHDQYIAQMYEHFGSQRAEGEWFQVSPNEAAEYLRFLKERANAV